MALSERLAYILDFDVKGGVRSLEKIGQTAEKELGKAERKLDKISGNLSKFGAGAVAAAGTAGVALFKMGQGAAEAEANLAGLEQIVGSTIAADLAKWAEDGAENLGLSERAIFKASTAFGSLGIVAGKTDEELTKFIKSNQTMAADFAAVADVAPTQVIDDLRAAYAGSGEVLQKYNIFVNDTNIKTAILNETGEKITGTLTSQQRVLGVNLLLQAEHAKVAGQWGRESGELAGQQAQLTANLQNFSDAIGRGVLPMLTSLVGKVNDAAGVLGSMDESTGGAIGRFAALGAGGLALIGTLSLVAGQVIKMRDRFTDLGADGTRSLNNLGKAARGVGGALGVAGVALAAYQVHAQRAAHHTQNVIDKANDLGRVADEQLGRVFTDAVLSGKLAGQDLDETMTSIARNQLEGAKRMLAHADATGVSTDATEALREAIKNEDAARRQEIKTTEEHGDALDEVTEATVRTSDAIRLQDEFIKDVNATYRDQQTELERTEEAQEAAAEAAEAYQDALDRQREAIEDLNNANLAMLGGDIAVRQAKRDSAEAVAEFTEVTKEAEEGTVEYEEAADNATLALLRQAEAATEYRIQQAEANGETVTAAEKAQIMEEELGNIAAVLGPGSPLLGGIQRYIDQLNNIPRNVSTTITTNNRTISVGGGGGNVGGTGSSGTRHSGGPVRAGNLYDVSGQTELLHENGKTFLIAGDDGQVEASKPAGTPTSPGGGGHAPSNVVVYATFNFDGPPQNVDQFSRHVRKALEREMRWNGNISGWRGS